MSLKRVQDMLNEKKIPFTYFEEDGLGSLDFQYRGIPYHIWEFSELSAPETPSGAETNIRSAGRDEEIEGEDYEEILLEELRRWS